MFEISFEKGKRPVVRMSHHVEVETTERGTYYTLVDGLGGDDAMIHVTNNEIRFISGGKQYLKMICDVYPELLNLEMNLE